MKIAHIIPPWGRFNFKTAQAIYGVAYLLMKEQEKKGHEVTLFAAEKSKIDCGFLVETIPSFNDLGISLYEDKAYPYNFVHAGILAEQAENFDIIHNHIEHIFLPFINSVRIPVISTIHGSGFSKEAEFIFKKYHGKFHAIGLSRFATKNIDYIKFERYIYNGVQLDDFPFNKTIVPSSPILWIGRFHPVKGALEANIISKKTRKNILFVGIKEKSFKDYYNKIVSELKKNSYARLLQKTVGGKRNRIFSDSKLTLFPIKWEEPFGLVMIESMATGTPVVGFARGSVKEVIKDGETGFIINPSDDDIRGNWIIKKTGIEGMVEAVKRIYSMPEEEYSNMRRNCRKHVEENFSAEHMVDEYEKAYKKIIE